MSIKKIIKYTSISLLSLFVLFFFLIFFLGEGCPTNDDYCLEAEPYYNKGP